MLCAVPRTPLIGCYKGVSRKKNSYTLIKDQGHVKCHVSNQIPDVIYCMQQLRFIIGLVKFSSACFCFPCFSGYYKYTCIYETKERGTLSKLAKLKLFPTENKFEPIC